MTATRPNPNSRLAEWQGFGLDFGVPGVVGYAIGYSPDTPYSTNYSRMGFIVSCMVVQGQTLGTNTEVMAGQVSGIPKVLHMVDFRWAAQYNFFSGRSPGFAVFFHPVPYLPPGTIELWRLT